MNNKFETLLPLFQKAVGKLREILQEPRSEIVRDSAIQRFEFNFELVWKILKVYLEERKGIRVYSPRDCLKEAFQLGLIDDDPLWLETVRLRNLTAHTYHEGTADQIYRALPKVLEAYKNLLKKLGG